MLRVEGVERGHRDAVGSGVDDDDVLAGDQHQERCVRCGEHRGGFAGGDVIRIHRESARHAQRCDRLTAGQTREKVRPNGFRRTPVDHHRGRHAGQERAGGELAAQAFHDDGQLCQAEARTAVRLGDRESGPAEFGCRRPDLGRMGGSVGEGGSGLGQRLQPGELAGHGVREVLVVVGDGQTGRARGPTHCESPIRRS